MKISRFAKPAVVLGVVAACMFGMVACSGSGSSGSGAAAATVNGVAIPEQDVTDQIQSIRESSQLEDKDQWGLFLVQQDLTPASVREQIIDSMVENELIKQGAAELGISVDSSEVDEYIESMKANYESDEDWNEALEQAGFTEESYREVIEESLIQQKVGDHFDEEAEVTDEDYVTAANTYAPYYDGAKRSSHILFSVDDTTDEEALAAAQAQAEDVLAQINAGTLDFADAARQYSGDTGSAENGGDVGWDVLNSFVSEYTDALSELELDQVSEPVTSQYGVHIIKVTDVFTAPEEVTSIDQIPAEFQDSIKEMAVSITANEAYTAWLDGLKESADIVINDMPSGLPYDIDLAPYEAQAEEEASADETATDDTSAVTVDESGDAVTVDETAADATSENGAADSTANAASEAASSESSGSNSN